MKTRPVLFALLLLLTTPAFADLAKAPNVQVTYTGIDAKYADAIAQTLSAALKIYSDDFGFDMPQTVVGSVTCAPGSPTRLFTDGKDHFTLNLPSQDKLLKPASSGTFNLYGMCHELGHMAMYRTLKDRDWMSTAAAEGFAHYAGSVVTDRVHAAKGPSLWPDPYDYRQDGSARLNKQLASPNPDDVTKAAGQWQKIESIIGQKAFPKLFKAWQDANIDPTKPNDTILLTLIKLDDSKVAPLADWWKSASPLFIEKRQASPVASKTIPANRLTGKPTKIALDDDSADDKRSIAGSGHARTFQTPDDKEWYIVAVAVHGGRYGPLRAPDTMFDISLCDPELKPISTWKKPYAAFPRGDSNWIRFEIPPTRVPKKFSLCLNFRPTATNGVYVSSDTSTQGNSVTGTPGKPPTPLKDSDWMIRVELDQPK